MNNPRLYAVFAAVMAVIVVGTSTQTQGPARTLMVVIGVILVAAAVALATRKPR